MFATHDEVISVWAESDRDTTTKENEREHVPILDTTISTTFIMTINGTGRTFSLQSRKNLMGS